jgi:hypothetical protein
MRVRRASVIIVAIAIPIALGGAWSVRGQGPDQPVVPQALMDEWSAAPPGGAEISGSDMFPDFWGLNQLVQQSAFMQAVDNAQPTPNSPDSPSQAGSSYDVSFAEQGWVTVTDAAGHVLVHTQLPSGQSVGGVARLAHPE